MLTSLLNTALLGTTKQPYRPDATTPAALQTAWAALTDSSAERRTYRYAALAFACAYGGQTPAQSADGWQLIPPAPAAEETLPPEAVAILGGWFKQKRQHLLHYAFARLRARDLALPTVLLPETIAHAQKHPADITDRLLGARGRWLFAEAGLRASPAAETDEDWQLLPFAARKDWLARLRHEAPDQAREQLAAIWSSAPANHRQDYIAILADNLTAADHPFLTAALKDRSKTVKESAHRLLMRLPDSAPAQQHLAWLRERLVWQDAGGWQYLDAPYTAEMKAAGIEEISPLKEESDAAWQRRQIILALPLSLWAQYLACDEEEAAARLAAHPPITPPNLCVGWVHQMNDRRFTLAMLPTIMHEHPDRISAELNFDAFLELSHSDRETLLANEDSARLLREQLRHNDYRDPWRDDTHENWGERYGLLACQHYLKSKTDVPDDNYQRLAASLPVNDHIAALITERLRTLPTDHPKHEDIAELAEYYRQKSQFAALLP